jgi:hypothetical protein
MGKEWMRMLPKVNGSWLKPSRWGSTWPQPQRPTKALDDYLLLGVYQLFFTATAFSKRFVF